MNDRTPLGRENRLVHVGSLRRSDGVYRARTLIIKLGIGFGRIILSSSDGAGLKRLVVRVLVPDQVAFFLLII